MGTEPSSQTTPYYTALWHENVRIRAIWRAADTLATVASDIETIVDEFELPTLYDAAHSLLESKTLDANPVARSLRKGERLESALEQAIASTNRYEWNEHKRVVHNEYVTALAEFVPSARQLRVYHPLNGRDGSQLGQALRTAKAVGTMAGASVAAIVLPSKIGMLSELKEPLGMGGALVLMALTLMGPLQITIDYFSATPAEENKERVNSMRQEAAYVMQSLTDEDYEGIE